LFEALFKPFSVEQIKKGKFDFKPSRSIVSGLELEIALLELAVDFLR
jgi:hypothetical protein